MKKYIINQIAKIANVSPRTLRHYDQIGLLKPALIGDNGYRYYQYQQLTTLMQILFYKELDFSLEEIKQIVQDPSFDMVQAFTDHRQLLRLKNKRIKRLIKTIDQIITSYQEHQPMNPQQTYKSFYQQEIDKYKDEVKTRWGHTDAYHQSMERYKSWTATDLKRIKQQGEQVTLKIAEVMDQPVEDDKVQELIKQHHAFIGNFYDCSMEMYQSLGEMYFTDPRFANYYEKTKPGLSKFIHRAINYYCQQASNPAIN